jgi:cyclopropane fatty-acyl-phospholipid synthase-like methyltransferase
MTLSTMKPFAESCDQNKHPILEVLRTEFAHATTVLEIGSGTGQHAVFFAAELPQLIWQTSEVVEHHAGIQAWINDSGLTNVLPPIELDVLRSPWPDTQYDAIFSANTSHIMAWPEVVAMFESIGKHMNSGATFCLYGPFNKHGQYTSDSNARFDQWLKARDPNSGVRDMEMLTALAAQQGLELTAEHDMPANNKILVWHKLQA